MHDDVIGLIQVILSRAVYELICLFADVSCDIPSKSLFGAEYLCCWETVQKMYAFLFFIKERMSMIIIIQKGH